MSSLEPKRTPLVHEHERAGARMVEFAGWWMPVQYRGLKEEHLSVRSGVGLFDVSHMGEFRVSGPKAVESLQWMTTNDVSKLKAGEAQYSLFPNETGGLVDDLIVYCMRPDEEYLLCVNAANIEKDFAYVQKHNRGAVITNESADWGQIAVQGPRALTLLDRLFPASEGVNAVAVGAMKPFTHQEYAWNGTKVLVARTGYTGEDGAEVFVPKAHTAALWNELLEKGKDLGVEPIGLGARDTLRLEMKYSLYGHEIDETTNPYEAGLGWVTKPLAKEFVGRDAIVAVKEQGVKRKLIGFELVDRGIPRQGYELQSPAGEVIGICTSGTMSPSTGASIGIGYVTTPFAADGSEIMVMIRGKATKAKVCPTPFVKRS
ncbi:MAG: glycine cleavage system aminomethyltransferase GcvT [Bdellovibrionales bacterium]|nr:glycine cleavage system aminomethyltransferase GcvT [Bdellovibrionales bacterium]